MKANDQKHVSKTCGVRFSNAVKGTPLSNVRAIKASCSKDGIPALIFNKRYSVKKPPKLNQDEWLIPAIYAGSCLEFIRIAPPWIEDEESDKFVSDWEEKAAGSSLVDFFFPASGKKFIESQKAAYDKIALGESSGDAQLDEQFAGKSLLHNRSYSGADTRPVTDYLAKVTELLENCKDDNIWRAVENAYKAGWNASHLPKSPSVNLIAQKGLPLVKTQKGRKKGALSNLKPWQRELLSLWESSPNNSHCETFDRIAGAETKYDNILLIELGRGKDTGKYRIGGEGKFIQSDSVVRNLKRWRTSSI
jgi:hypothetical protein